MKTFNSFIKSDILDLINSKKNIFHSIEDFNAFIEKEYLEYKIEKTLNNK